VSNKVLFYFRIENIDKTIRNSNVPGKPIIPAFIHVLVRISVADPDLFDLDPVFHFDTDPDPAFQFDIDPDLTV
jgi:hypothetical protein